MQQETLPVNYLISYESYADVYFVWRLVDQEALAP